jgi:hypothetical protein
MAHPAALFALRNAACSPLVRLQKLEATPMGPGLFRVEAIVGNEGYLPTNLTDIAAKIGYVPTVKARLELGPGVELADGAPEQDLGQLAGFSERRDPWNAWGAPWKDTRKQATWQVRVAPGAAGRLRVVATAQKGGTVTRELALPA